MSVHVVSRRYANALADALGKQDSKVIKSELLSWEELIETNHELKSVFSNPALAHMGKERVLEQLLAKTKPTNTTANFLRVLLQNGRLINLPEINKTFAKVLEERAGLASAKVVSARELTSDEKNNLQSNIEKLTGKKVSLNCTIDQNIIGGVVTTVGSMVYDSSIKTQLENLRQELVHG